MKNLYKKILVSIFVLLLIFPIVQNISQVIKFKSLKGAIIKSEKPTFSIQEWFTAEFQSKYEKYIVDTLGIREPLVRLYNQLQFEFYKNTTAKSVVVGKDNYLFEIGYIRAYNGYDFVGSLRLKKISEKIARLQDTLEKLDKSLIICFAPGKGSFYNEYFPNRYASASTDSTNYKVLKRYLEMNDVNFIDANAWFLRMKNSSDCLLYPKYGIHWSYYGEQLFTDSLISYIESLRGIQMNHLKQYDIKRIGEYKYRDYDIADGMNLMADLEPEVMCYPKSKWIIDSANAKPKTIVIADSYFWGLFNRGFLNKACSPGGFWYYNRTVFPGYKGKTKTSQLNLKEQIDKSDVIVLLGTEIHYKHLGFSFVDEALKLYYNSNDEIFNHVDPNDQIKSILKRIKSNSKWFNKIKIKAEKRGEDLEEVLLKEAYWVYKKKVKKK
jgi:hypothetical protein